MPIPQATTFTNQPKILLINNLQVLKNNTFFGSVMGIFDSVSDLDIYRRQLYDDIIMDEFDEVDHKPYDDWLQSSNFHILNVVMSSETDFVYLNVHYRIDGYHFFWEKTTQ